LKLHRLKDVRELHGWSQAKLAEVSGVSRDSISNYETGQREAWPATAKRLADALGVEIADLREPTGKLTASGKGEAQQGAGRGGRAIWRGVHDAVAVSDTVTPRVEKAKRIVTLLDGGEIDATEADKRLAELYAVAS
jgi:transcriptional regulator with XRE-family HTH domain